MHPITHARTRPDHPAIVMAGSGETVSYAALDAAANRFAHWARHQGLQEGDVFALWMENSPRFLEIAWGAQRCGLVTVPVSTHLAAAEVDYILADSGAKALVTSTALGALDAALASSLPRLTFGAGAEELLAQQPAGPIADPTPGADMLYSSGTTGRPKGVRPTAALDPAVEAPTPLMALATRGFGMPADGSLIYLSPGPLYHAAPYRWSMTVHRLGGTVVVMEKFDPAAALAAIERYRVTDSQWVPTHFVRLLRLSEEERNAHDLSSHARAIHAAAPCPVAVKRAMIDWWGPILLEYYAGSEGNGMTLIDSAQWLDHPGSVGHSILGKLHVCGPDGQELPPGEEGLVWFESAHAFEYHGNAAKTAEVTHPQGWTTLGDIGRVDADGYLTLTDRRSNLIISGGVNIYPQEIEDALLAHPAVLDAAVIGAPDAEMGQQVIAVIRPAEIAHAGETLEQVLRAHLAERLSRLKIPREFHFRENLPREANGKLYKRRLVEEFS